MQHSEGFLESLFDCSFTRFVTPRIIKLLFVLAIVVAALMSVVMIAAGFGHSLGMGVVTLIIFAPLYFLLAVLGIRVSLELILVIFRIEENTARMSGREQLHGTGAQQTSVPPTIGESAGPQSSPPTI